MRKEKGDIDVEARRQKKEVESRIAKEKEEAEVCTGLIQALHRIHAILECASGRTQNIP